MVVLLACSTVSTSQTKFGQLSHLVALSRRCSLILLWLIPAMTQPIIKESLIASRLWASLIMIFLSHVATASRRSPSNAQNFSLFVGQDNFQRFPFVEENQCVIDVCCNTLQLSTCPFIESKIRLGHSSLISRSCLH